MKPEVGDLKENLMFGFLATFLARKADALAAEEKQNALFDKQLAEEEVWIRQGIKARRTSSRNPSGLSPLSG